MMLKASLLAAQDDDESLRAALSDHVHVGRPVDPSTVTRCPGEPRPWNSPAGVRRSS